MPNALPVGPIVMKKLALATAQNHSCIVGTSHESRVTSHGVNCWGLDLDGELGLNNVTVHDAVPTAAVT